MAYDNKEAVEVKNRIAETLRNYRDDSMAAVLWKGYISGIFVKSKGKFSDDDYDEMMDFLPQVGDEEQHVYFSRVETMEERLEALEDYKRQMASIARRREQK